MLTDEQRKRIVHYSEYLLDANGYQPMIVRVMEDCINELALSIALEAREKALEEAACITENYARQDNRNAVTVCDLASSAIRVLKGKP